MTKKLPLALMIGAVLSASNAFGLGVGDIKVNSALNQRLNAEIELLSSVEGELDDVSVKLASQDSFKKLKLNRPYFLTGIVFKVTTRADGTPIVKLSTKDTIREPFLDFLVEVNWPKGRMLREYTVLLDPPVTMAAQSAPKAQAPAVKQAPAEVIVGQAPAEPTADEPMVDEPVGYTQSSTVDTGRVDELGFPIYSDTPADAASAPATISYTDDSYGPVSSDETLWSIATKVRSGDVTNQQMMLALFEANPDAFVNGDIHQVKKGAVLRIPDEASITSRNVSEALTEVRQLNTALPESAITTSEMTSEQPGISERAAEMAPTEEPAPAPADEGKLSLLAPSDAGASQAATSSSAELNNLNRELAMARESLSSQQMENQELRSRMQELESTVAEMEKLKRLLELQNQEMAQLQKQVAEAGQAAQQPMVQPADVMEASTEPDQVTDAQPEPAPEPEPAPAEEPTVGAGTEVTTVSVEEEPAEPAPAPPVQQRQAKKEPLDIAMDYINQAKDNPTMLGIAAAVLLVLIALIVLVFKRRKGGAVPAEAEPETAAVAAEDSGVTVEKASMFAVIKDKLSGMGKKKSKADEEEVPDIDEMFEGIEEAAETEIHGEAETAPEMDQTADQTILEAPVDSGAAAAVAGMDFEADSGAAEAVEDEATPPEASAPVGPDPLEEVDVYEAFGDFEQAAEIVKQALSDDPNNNDFKLRLFNVYQNGGLADEFSTAAVQYESSMEGSSQWDQVVEMGKSFVPDCPVWGNSGSAPAAPASEAGDMAATMAMDSGMAANFADSSAETAAPEDDMGMDFDMGGSPEAETSATEEPLEFEGMGETAVLDVEPASAPAEEAAAPSTDSNDMEFDLGGMEFESADETETTDSNEMEFDLGDTGIEEPTSDETALSAEPEDDGLEFDMGDLGGAEEPTAAAEDTGGLEFELDDSAVSESSEAVSETVQVNVTPEELEAGGGLEEGLSEDPTVMLDDIQETAADENSATDTSMGIDLSDFDLDMDDSGTADALETADDSQGSEPSGDSLGLSGLEFDSELEAAGEPAAADELSLDMDSGSEDPTVLFGDDSGGSDESLSGEGDEVSTKLDLARAYIDMGDSDGAKGILDEVMAEGNDAQKAEAESLLQQIS